MTVNPRPSQAAPAFHGQRADRPTGRRSAVCGGTAPQTSQADSPSSESLLSARRTYTRWDAAAYQLRECDHRSPRAGRSVRGWPVNPLPSVGHSGSGMIANTPVHRVLLAKGVEPDHPVCRRPGDELPDGWVDGRRDDQQDRRARKRARATEASVARATYVPHVRSIHGQER
jgi:hypothetical protein